MPRPTPDPRLWKNIASALVEMDADELRGLVHDLYKLSPENRAFLASWLGDEDAPAELLQGYKAKITAQFFTRGKARINGGCNLSLCRRMIKEYRRVTTAPEMAAGFDLYGTLDLGLHYVEIGTAYLNEVGWEGAQPYDSMGAVMGEVTELCQHKGGRKWAAAFLPRVRAVAEAGQGFGYGYSDELGYMQEVFEKTATAFERGRAKRSE